MARKGRRMIFRQMVMAGMLSGAGDENISAGK